MNQKILITSAGGFVGTKLSAHLAKQHSLKFISRSNQVYGETFKF